MAVRKLFGNVRILAALLIDDAFVHKGPYSEWECSSV